MVKFFNKEQILTDLPKQTVGIIAE